MELGEHKFRWVIMFFILWLHISLIDLFLISTKGATALWQQNLTLKALAVHLGIAILATLVIWLAYRLQLVLWRRKHS